MSTMQCQVRQVSLQAVSDGSLRRLGVHEHGPTRYGSVSFPKPSLNLSPLLQRVLFLMRAPALLTSGLGEAYKRVADG